MNQKIKAYTLVRGVDPTAILNKATDLLAQGWQPLGGISIATVKVNTQGNYTIVSDNNAIEKIEYAQAFVKPEQTA